MGSRVLLAVDGLSGPSRLYAATAEFLRSNPAQLHVVHVLSDEAVDESAEDAPEEFRSSEVLLGTLEEELREAVAKELPEVASSVAVYVRTGEPGRTILELAEEVNPQYLIIGVRKRSRVGKLLFGSTAQEVLLESPRPVLAVPVSEKP